MAALGGIPFLDEDAVRARLRFDDLIPAMEQALIDYSAGRITQPDRQLLPVTAHDGYFAAMPAVGASVGVKLVTFYPGNVERGLPTHLAMIMLFDPATGAPRALMDARLITEMRTAAVSAAAARTLARADAHVLTMLGTGVQARAHIEALRLVRPIEEVRVWGRDPAKADALAAKTGARAFADAEAAVRGADLVVTATSAKQAILRGAWLTPGTHVTAVGWNGHDGRELDDAVMTHPVYVESRAGTAAESGNIRGSGAAITAEIGAVLAGTVTADATVTTVFDSVGMAAEDLAAATLVWEKAS